MMKNGLYFIVIALLVAVDCEQSLFGQSRLSSAGLEIAN